MKRLDPRCSISKRYAWKYSNGKCSLMHQIIQTFLSRTVIFFDPRHMTWLTKTSKIMKKSRIQSMAESVQKMTIVFYFLFVHCLEDGRRQLTSIKHNLLNTFIALVLH